MHESRALCIVLCLTRHRRRRRRHRRGAGTAPPADGAQCPAAVLASLPPASDYCPPVAMPPVCSCPAPRSSRTGAADVGTAYTVSSHKDVQLKRGYVNAGTRQIIMQNRSGSPPGRRGARRIPPAFKFLSL